MRKFRQIAQLFLRPLVVWAASCLLLAGGCAVHDHEPQLLPTFMREVTLPPATLPPPDDREINLTSARLGVPLDEEIAPPPRMGITLDQAIESTLLADPKLQSAWEAINQAKADLLTSSLVPNPTLLSDILMLPLTRSFTPTKQGGPPQTDVIVGFPIDWFLFGKRAAAMASAREGVEANAADFANTVRQRVAATVSAYFDVVETEALLVLARDDLANQEGLEKITAERVKLGGIGTIELDRIRLAMYESQRELRRRETALAVAKANLRALMGQRDLDPRFDVAGRLRVEAPVAPPAIEEALGVAENERPDLIALRRQLTKAEADVRLEKTKGYPTVMPNAGFTRQFQRTTIGFPDASSYDLALNVSVPLFDRNQGNIAKAQSLRTQAVFNLQGQLVVLRAEVEQAWQEFRAAHLNVTRADPKTLETARSVRERIKAAYKVGGRPLTDVLDAQRAYREAVRGTIINQSAYWHALHRLNAAVGRQMLK